MKLVGRDLEHLDDTKYWAAALLNAIRCGDLERESIAQANLERLGFILGFIQVTKDAKGNMKVSPNSEPGKRRFTTEGKELVQ